MLEFTTKYNNYIGIIVVVLSFIMILYTFYYLVDLSYSIGLYKGISEISILYNVSLNSAIKASLVSLPSVEIALDIIYVMVPISLMVFSMSILWMFSKMYSKWSISILAVGSIVYLMLIYLLQSNFHFNKFLYSFLVPYITGFLLLILSIYSILSLMYSSESDISIEINPLTPYSNMINLSNKLMKHLSGDIRIIDTHFDNTSFDNLSRLIVNNMKNYKSIYILTYLDNNSRGFGRGYVDFKNEVENRNINFQLRIMDKNDFSEQHERIMMDSEKAFKIPPINIINKKSEHIVGIEYEEALERFNKIWNNAKKYENFNKNL